MKVWKRNRTGLFTMSLRATASLTTILALGAWACPGAAAQSKEETVDLGSGITLELVWIPAGTFMMGSPENEQGRDNNEGPQREVTLSAGFWMGKYEVTQEQWASVMGNNPSHIKGRKLPVHRVSWDDCQEFVQRLSDKVGGKEFRLPTEAEWEYACRAGSSGKYCFGGDLFGEDAAKLEDYAWFSQNSGYSETLFGIVSFGTPHDVGQKKPNAWGLYDMHGNVAEWCANKFFDHSHTPPLEKVFHRGGSWVSYAGRCRSAYRESALTSDPACGFRIVR